MKTNPNPQTPSAESGNGLPSVLTAPSDVSLTKRGATTKVAAPLPVIYDFTNYREYLQAFFEAKKAANPTYSASSFARRAGLGENSRGYLKLVITGKRNLSAQTIRAFSEALSLGVEDSIYFENLVLFNQADRAKDRKYYFERLTASQPRKKSGQFELLESQFRYFSNWYLVAIRELVATQDFDESPAAISKALKGRITSKEAAQGLADLIRLELLVRDENGRLQQSTPIIQLTAGFFSPFVQNFHLGMMEQARLALIEDDYSERNASGVTLSCTREQLPEIKKAIDEFRAQITERFGVSEAPADSVLQVNVQLFQLTQLPKGKKGETP